MPRGDTLKKMTVSQFKEAWAKAMEGIGNDFGNVIVETCRVDTGNLKQQIDIKAGPRKSIISMPIYGWYLEHGTPPHIIRPKNKKMLAFARSGGKLVHHNDNTVSTKFTYGGKTVETSAIFASVVHHPGTRPYPWIRSAIQNQLPDIIRKNLKRHFT